jgi:hypothetical protein
MLKKLILVALLVMSLGVSNTFAASTVQPPSSVGTYVDFYHDVRLQWKPVQGAVSYKIYAAKGYNAQTGFKLDHTLINYSLRYINRQYWIVDYAQTPEISWYTIRVTSVDKYGNESSPCVTNVNVWR